MFLYYLNYIQIKKMRCILFILLLLLSIQIHAQDIVGEWISIDRETNVEKSIVEIFERNGKYHGKIVEFLEEGAEPDSACQHCKGKMKGKKLMGFEVLRNFEKDDDEFEDGTIIDPENDKTYDAKIWVDEDDSSILHLRGYVSFFYQTIEWKRAVK